MTGGPPISDDQLIRYLLGTLPVADAERLDERSITDDELAERLETVETELLDAYAAGRLPGDQLQRFECFYLSSPHRREKAAFAKSLRAAVEKPARPSSVIPMRAGQMPPKKPARASWWPVAAAAAFVVSVGLLAFQNVVLQRELRQSATRVADADRRATTALQELQAEQKATAATKQALADARTPLALGNVALVLLPQTRGVSAVPVLALPPGSNMVSLDLALETATGTSYDVALRDPATNRTVWRSAPVALQRVRETPMVPVVVPAALLKSQHYALDLFELRSGIAPEFVSSYTFEVLRQ